jgi:hypothetical protein
MQCNVCGGKMRAIGSRLSPFTGDSYQLHQCPSCWYSCVEDPPDDYAALYDEAYYRGEGADPLTDYEGEMRDPVTVRLHEWRGILRVCGPMSVKERTTRRMPLHSWSRTVTGSRISPS